MKDIGFQRFYLIVLLGIITTFPIKADDEYFTHNRAAFSGTLTSSDSYSLEMSYHYMFCKFVGVGGALGYWSNYYDDGWASGSNWNIDEDDNRPSNFYLRPSVVLKSPSVRFKQTQWCLYAEPGIMLNVPYQQVSIEKTQNWTHTEYDYISTNKGQWFAIDVRLGINMDIGPCGFSAGYMMSNLDIYSQYRHLSYNCTTFEKFYPKKPFMQGAYLTLSYNF